jgi:ribosome biogenesis GTPase
MVNCKARGIFRKDGITPFVGDRVEIIRVSGSTDSSIGDSADKGGTENFDSEKDNAADASGAVIVEIHPRDNEIVRPPVANIDYIVFVISTVDPAPNLEALDKFLTIAIFKHIKPIICVTKTDLADDRVWMNIQDTYKDVADVFVIDYTKTFEDSAVSALMQIIAGKKAVFTGNTGVGKSTLLNYLDPSINAKVGEISKKLGRGKHTTRTVEYYKLKNGAYVADTPGFGVFDTRRYDYIYKAELPYCFPDFKPYLHKCRFQGCTHTKELGCAIIEAVASGLIAQTRFDSYLRMYHEASNLHPWERTL